MQPKVKADLQASANDRANVRKQTAAAKEQLAYLIDESTDRRKTTTRDRRLLYERRHKPS
jgi:hypothetical protein